MKILCLAVQDHAAQQYLLARGLRDYAKLDAKSIRLENTYMDYPTDVHGGSDDYIQGQIEDADLLIMNDDFYNKFRPRVMHKPRVVKCHGTFTRLLSGWHHQDWLVNKTLYVASPIWTLSSSVGFCVQHIPPMTDHRLLPDPDPPSDKLIVGCATRNDPYKGLDVDSLKKINEMDGVEVQQIEYMPWQSRTVDGKHVPGALEVKSKWHVVYEWTREPSYGLNVVECLMMGQSAVCHLGSWTAGFFTHDVPPFWTLESFQHYLKNLHSKTPTDLWDETHQNDRRGWAIRNHDLSTQIPKWRHLIEWVMQHQPKKPTRSSRTTPTTTPRTTRRSRKRSKPKA